MKRKNQFDDTQPIKAQKGRGSTKLGWIIVIALVGGFVLFLLASPEKWLVGNPRVESKTSSFCQIYTSQDRGRFDFQVIISGASQERAHVDVAHNGETLEVDKRYRKTFSDSADPYILQYYSTYGLQSGNYTISWKLGTKTAKRTLNLKEADWRIDVYCD